MNIWILLLLSVVQGLTEFLPVSSSGHLLLLENIFGIKNNLLLLNLFLHISTLLAVLIYYRRIVINLLKKPFQPLTYKLIISTILTVIIALIYKYFNLSETLDKFYGYYFIVTGALLLITHYFRKKTVRFNVGEVSYKSAVIAGLVQGVAVLPGISRSGSTISSLVLCGNEDEKSAEYSFVLSIPVIVGGFILELFSIDDLSNIFYGLPPIMFFVSFAVTFLVSLFALKITEKFLKQNKFIYFSIYLFIVGIVTIFFV